MALTFTVPIWGQCNACARNGGAGRSDVLKWIQSTKLRSNDSEECKIAELRKITPGRQAGRQAAGKNGTKRVTKIIVTGNSHTHMHGRGVGGIIFESRLRSVITLLQNVWGPHFSFPRFTSKCLGPYFRLLQGSLYSGVYISRENMTLIACR